MRVYEAIAKVQAELAKEGVGKDRKASFGDKFSYRGIDDIYNSLSILMSQCNLTMLPNVLERTTETREQRSEKDGKEWIKNLHFAVVRVEYVFVCTTDGTKHSVVTVGEAMDSGDKATIKAMSQAHKTACIQTFCIPTERDPDIVAKELEEEKKAISEGLEKELEAMLVPVSDEASYAAAREKVLPLILRLKQVAPDRAATQEAKMVTLKEKFVPKRPPTVDEARQARRD